MSAAFPAADAVPSPFASWTGHHAGLRVPDFGVAQSWYIETLDFRLVESTTLGATTFGFLAPSGSEDGFGIELVANPQGAERPSYANLVDSHNLMGWHHLCLRCADVIASIEELKRRGVTIVSEPFDVAALNIRIAFFADPWGNLFELLQPLEI